jgi:hypothetical protein
MIIYTAAERHLQIQCWIHYYRTLTLFNNSIHGIMGTYRRHTGDNSLTVSPLSGIVRGSCSRCHKSCEIVGIQLPKKVEKCTLAPVFVVG